MAVLTEEAAYEALLQELRKHGLHWVATQVQEHVRIGKTFSKPVAPLRESDWQGLLYTEATPARLPKGSRTLLTATKEYSASERLNVVLTAIESAVVDTAAMEAALVAYFEPDAGTRPSIAFEPDELDTAKPFELTAHARERHASVERLRAALERLREENRGDDNP